MHAYLIEGNNQAKIEEEILKILSQQKAQRLPLAMQKIEEVREIINLTKLASTHKIAIIISDVEKSSPEAINALLKTLEEPPKHIIFILVASVLSNLPATVLSRCVLIKTQKNTDVDSQTLEQFHVFLNSSLGSKFNLLNNLSTRDTAIDFLESGLLSAHKLLHESDIDKTKMINFLERADKTLTAIKANGNVKLQLTNLFIQI